ncbi:MAG: hypothetical protein HC945_03990 [Nitrosarchaeum sp.]|nr:hypothetical protein [Nitrosarchaeum sp.]
MKEDIHLLDRKLDNHLDVISRQQQAVETLTSQVYYLNKIVHVGNGQPSLLIQTAKIHQAVEAQRDSLSDIKSEIDDLKDNLQTLSSFKEDLKALKDKVGAKTPKEVQIERLRTVGKIAGTISLALPGILSFITTWMS